MDLPRRAVERRGARAGITLPEAAIAIALSILLSGSAIVAAVGGYSAFRNTSRNADHEAQVRRAIDRVVLELLSTGEEELDPDPAGAFGASNLLFRKAAGLDGTAVVWGVQNRLAFQHWGIEDDDGLDDDGDGLVDEGRLVLVRDDGGPNETLVVLCNDVSELLEGETANGADDNGNGLVDEAGFNVHRIDNVLFVRLSLEQASDSADPIVRTLETSVRLRN